jgi:eukaryotic-like serine/threonine-protein kinase
MSGRSSDSGAGGGPTLGNQVGSYRLVRLLGGRGNGLVYEVEDLARGGRAAMRVLPPGRAAAFGAVRRLFIDTRALGQLNNPHLVAVKDLIEAQQPGEVSAIVMELLEGRSLGSLLAANQPLPRPRILSILTQVLDGLRAIHGLRLVHGDLQPDNIFLSGAPAASEDHVKLLGFGLARPVAADRSDDPWGPDEDTSIHSPAYLAPEQAFGRDTDHRTDIYGFGVILYQLLCGQLPFGGRNLKELLVELEMDPPRPAPRQVLADPLGRSLDSIARRCLEKDPARRWADVDQLKSAFDGLLSGGTAIDPPPRPTGGRRWLLAAALAATLVVVGFFLTR